MTDDHGRRLCVLLCHRRRVFANFHSTDHHARHQFSDHKIGADTLFINVPGEFQGVRRRANFTLMTCRCQCRSTKSEPFPHHLSSCYSLMVPSASHQHTIKAKDRNTWEPYLLQPYNPFLTNQSTSTNDKAIRKEQKKQWRLKRVFSSTTSLSTPSVAKRLILSIRPPRKLYVLFKRPIRRMSTLRYVQYLGRRRFCHFRFFCFCSSWLHSHTHHKLHHYVLTSGRCRQSRIWDWSTVACHGWIGQARFAPQIGQLDGTWPWIHWRTRVTRQWQTTGTKWTIRNHRRCRPCHCSFPVRSPLR